jgi:H/ACA ribonucleoprotein complex subunit 1
MVCKLTNKMVPYFNAGTYLENKTKIGKVDEILGPVNGSYFTVKPDGGVNATSFKDGDKVFIGPDKLLPMSRFTGENAGRGGGGGRGAARGGRGGARGGFAARGGRGGGRGGKC